MHYRHRWDLLRHRDERPGLGIRRSVVGILAVTVTGIVAGACSSPSPTDSVASLPGHTTGTQASGPLTQAQSDRDMVDFTRCLRAHGLAEPDPVHRPGHQGLSVQVPTPGPSTNAALSACNHFLAPIAQMKQAHARQELASWLPGLTHYAECMRAHDIAMLDPGPQGQLNLGSVPGIVSDFGRYSPQFRSADATCRHLLPSAVHDDGTGP
ncbi:MAG TPA: hypothetical protein VKR22_10935 [Acidimicrobiales bacterium]|nr:hypothetical protein [Acidimicrobiales bacterium]